MPEQTSPPQTHSINIQIIKQAILDPRTQMLQMKLLASPSVGAFGKRTIGSLLFGAIMVFACDCAQIFWIIYIRFFRSRCLSSDVATDPRSHGLPIMIC